MNETANISKNLSGKCKDYYLIRWEKKVENYIGMVHVACAWITYRRGGLFA
jgi:hypothetical protein